ncbi:MAG: metal-dependent hydrolase [Candidatus Micrarchaeia archaeon]
MPGFYQHIAVGLLFVVVVLLFLRPQLSFFTFATLLFFLIGSVAPDVDHPFSKPRKYIKFALTSLLFLSSLILLIFHRNSLVVLFGVYYPLAATFLLLLPATTGWLLDSIIPPHRGFMHTIAGALLLSLLLLILLSIIGIEQALYLAVAFFLGYLLHILIDFV